MTDNIVFKCYYYKPKEKYKPSQEKEIAKREFLSCTASYNYVSYVDTGSIDNPLTGLKVISPGINLLIM